MKTISFTLLLSILLSSLPLDLRAMGGRIKSPILVIPKPAKPGDSNLIASPDDCRTLVFKNFEEAFLDGYFISATSWLYFAGDADTLSRMLNELSKTPGARFGVRFTSKPIGVSVPFRQETELPPTTEDD